MFGGFRAALILLRLALAGLFRLNGFLWLLDLFRLSRLLAGLFLVGFRHG